MSDAAPAQQRQLGEIIARLGAEYGEVHSFLSYRTPFELLIAVILSAQTTDRQVNLITPQLFERWPTPQRLAESDPAEVEKVLRSIGFFRAKTRSIRATARQIVERFGGSVPESMEDLTSLPGVGRKSANVVRGTVYGRPAIIVDTHFGRVVRRLGLTDATDPTKVERELSNIIPDSEQMRFSMLANKHGRVYCHARKPDCDRCPVRDLCAHPRFAGDRTK